MTTIDTSPTQLPLTRRITLALSDIKLAHSVFALPFAILGAFLVAPYTSDGSQHTINWTAFLGMLPLIILCMIFARTWAMLVNRVADSKIDADNDRTKNRAFASGALSLKDGYLMLAASALGFIATASCFGFFYTNWLPAILSIPVLIWIGFYSFTKRFTFLCHVFLGGALAASPIAAAIAINPSHIQYTLEIYTIAIMVLFWVAGFDIIYALQDLDYDQRVKLNSIPAKFGWKRAIWIARAFHTIALSALVYAWYQSSQLSTLFAISAALTAVLLIYEHAILTKRGKAGIPIAFFTLNGLISLTIGALGSLDIILF